VRRSWNSRDRLTGASLPRRAPRVRTRGQTGATVATDDEPARKASRLARGSAPTKSHPNAPGRHAFSKENQPPRAKVGRPKGAQNKVTRELRDLILEAVDRVGSDGRGKDGRLGYLMSLATDVPSSYAVLLRAILPVDVKATVTHRRELTLDEAVAQLKARGLPPELIEYLRRVDDELGEDDQPDPYPDPNDLQARPPAKKND